eukprot:TRINITY_DN1294_c0_g2_i1.p1 TRINITY_DN1294_c0_g2~~TRINITY_DN1294_c0_g2_i1.p1  ORF type:complete len:403 (+),score=111.22 TRINITY_DN1294_c0_g2_i1:25-1209(+)
MIRRPPRSTLSSSSAASDVYKRQVYINLNNIHFGKRDDGVEVNDVVLPPWARKSSVRFVSSLMEMLESDYTSQNISKWIDLIFGYKQQGEEAEKAFNIFPQLSYRPEEALANTSGEQKEAFRMQAYHWGQTPVQRFTKKHPKRELKDSLLVYSIFDQSARPNAYSISSSQWKVSKSTRRRKIVKIFTSEGRDKKLAFTLITIEGVILEYAVEFSESRDQSKPASLFIINSYIKEYNNYYFDKDMTLLDDVAMAEFPLVLVQRCNPPHLAQGGYKDGRIQLTQFAKLGECSSFNAHSSTVICLAIDKDEKIAVSGSAAGEVVVYEVADGMQWRAKRRMWDHSALSHIFLSSDMLLLSTSGLDGIVNLYTYSGNMLRTFQSPGRQPVKYVILKNEV